jgi:hypothetical protein
MSQSPRRAVATEVVQHGELPELNLLLCGRHPAIFSSREAPPRPPAAPAPARAARAGSVPAGFVPGSVPRADRGPRDASLLWQHSRLLSQVRGVQQFSAAVGGTLQVYANAHRVKRRIREREFEDRYYVPLQMRIRERMVGPRYAAFLGEKARLARSMDARPVPIHSPRRLPPIAQIRVPEAGLRDPKNRYLEQAAKEERLSRVVNEANGIAVPPRRPPTARPPAAPAYALSHQTRFFFGADPELGNRAGQRVFPGTARSTVGDEIGGF